MRSVQWSACLPAVSVVSISLAACGAGSDRPSPAANKAERASRAADCSQSMPPCAPAPSTSGAGGGTGVLRHVRFVGKPILVYVRKQPEDPTFAGYRIYFRTSRDLPRNHARGVNGFFAPFERTSDPILGLLARHGRWCFTEDVSADPRTSGIPTQRGALVRIALVVMDSHHNRGRLPVTVRLRVRRAPGAAYTKPYPYPKEIGCPLA